MDLNEFIDKINTKRNPSRDGSTSRQEDESKKLLN